MSRPRLKLTKPTNNQYSNQYREQESRFRENRSIDKLRSMSNGKLNSFDMTANNNSALEMMMSSSTG
jgi:hypothetical protein